MTEATQNNEQETKEIELAPQDSKQTNQYRMIFYSLLEAAMRYREGYFREDLEQTAISLAKMQEDYYTEKKTTFSARKKLDDRLKDHLLTISNKAHKFNETIYAELERLTKSLSPDAQKGFDNYSTAFGLMAEELEQAKNTTEILTVCKLYNSGYFDKDLQFSEQEAKDLNEKFEATEIVADGDHLRTEQPPVKYGAYPKGSSPEEEALPDQSAEH